MINISTNIDCKMELRSKVQQKLFKMKLPIFPHIWSKMGHMNPCLRLGDINYLMI